MKSIIKSHARVRRHTRSTASLTARLDSAHVHAARKWSEKVTTHSNAMTLKNNIFTRSASAIAMSLKKSAQLSHRRKSSSFRSAMSMLNFYINRAGRNLTPSNRRKLAAAKIALRKAFGRKPQALA